MSWKHDNVLIVGAGPVGAMTALMLAQQGIPVTVLESEAGVVEDYRASTFHAATLQLLEASGATEALLEMGLIAPSMQYRDRQLGKIVELDMSELGNVTRYPFRLQCEQFKLVEWAYRQLAALPSATLLFNHRVTGVKMLDDGAAVAVDTPEGPQIFRGDFLIATDGGRSTVRKALDIEFEGFTYPQHFLVAGTPFDFRSAMPDLCSVNYTADAREWYLLLQIPDMWRVVLPVDPTLEPAEAVQEQRIQTMLNNLLPRDTPYDIVVKAIYRVSQRVAAQYRRNRVFLAGDAAHINNPLGGVGLNGGLMDAVSLTQTLGKVWHGQADEAALDGYEVQRKPEAIHGVNAMTERNKKVLEESNPDVRARNIDHWRRLGTDAELRRQHMLEASMIISARRCGMIA